MSQRLPHRAIGIALTACLVLWALAANHGPAAAEAKDVKKEVNLERTVRLEVELLGVETLPVRGTRAIARFRVREGPYRGALFSLSYDYARPVRMRRWDMHDEAGFRRIGGARMDEPAPGQWDRLFPLGSTRPVEALALTLSQYDLNEGEHRRRWHFTEIVSVEPLEHDGLLDSRPAGRSSFTEGTEGNR